MHEGTAKTIRDAAPFLLTSEAQQWKGRRYLKEPIKNALDILDILMDYWQSAEAISAQMPTPIAPKNVGFILRILLEEGYPIESKQGKGWKLRI